MDKPPPLPVKIIGDDNAEDDQSLVKNNLEKLLEYSPPERQTTRPSIYIIPHYIKDVQPKAFIPQLVSFGPYHYGKPHLLPMEQHKRRAFLNFNTSCRLPVSSIVKNVSDKMEVLRGSYDRLDDEWKDSAKFLELMILDGCFMLEVLNSIVDRPDGDQDPIFSAHGRLYIIEDIIRDMLLLENQLPMALLDELYFMKTKNRNQVKKLVGKCIRPEVKTDLPGKYSHFLDIYRAKLLLPPVPEGRNESGRKQNLNGDNDYEDQFIRPATRLREAGIRFRKSKSLSLKDVSFDRKRGVLNLPQLVVEDATESAFLNVMAFEKLHIGAGNEVTDFVFLMDNLIDVDKDVELLASQKILVNAIGKDEDVAELFNLLAKGAVMDTQSHLYEVHKFVNAHCSRSWNEWCASLRETYFQNPWAIISLVAALLGFAIVILQTFYQLYDYYHPR